MTLGAGALASRLIKFITRGSGAGTTRARHFKQMARSASRATKFEAHMGGTLIRREAEIGGFAALITPGNGRSIQIPSSSSPPASIRAGLHRRLKPQARLRR